MFDANDVTNKKVLLAFSNGKCEKRNITKSMFIIKWTIEWTDLIENILAKTFF